MANKRAYAGLGEAGGPISLIKYTYSCATDLLLLYLSDLSLSRIVAAASCLPLSPCSITWWLNNRHRYNWACYVSVSDRRNAVIANVTGPPRLRTYGGTRRRRLQGPCWMWEREGYVTMEILAQFLDETGDHLRKRFILLFILE